MKRFLVFFLSLVSISTMLTGCKIQIKGDKADTVNSSETGSDEDSDDYIIPKSNKETLQTTDLNSLNETELKYAINEIYARRGKVFDDAVYNKYLESKDWYEPSPSYSDSDLSVIEKDNIKFIQDYINSHTTTEATTTTTTKAAVPQQTTPPPVTNYHVNDDEIYNLFSNYAYGLIDAINSGSYYKVSPYIMPGSPLESDQMKLVSNLYSKGTTESLEGYNINSINWIDASTCTISVTETEGIYKANGSSQVKTFNWTYTCKLNNGYYQMYSIK